ncbi:integration host factor subunit beta [Methylophilaceae bacterium]|jgi:integration host factor subunit beta|nr:integration host factor subunit beta [Methylophilaceae bacterium]
MTKSELITLLSDKFSQLVHKDAELSVKTIIDSLSNTLSKGGRVEIRGFGSFSLNHRPARLGRNPKTGEKVNVPEKFVPHFKPGKELKIKVDK